MRLDRWLQNAQAGLKRAEITNASLEAQVLAAHVLGTDRGGILTHPEWEINEAFANELLQRRLQHEPLAYVLGYREFYGRRFAVTPSVLIPRQETETIITAFLESDLPEASRILDLGAGSGCIGITLKLECSGLSVTLADVSANALKVAQANAKAMGADVRIVESDGFAAFSNECFDAIVSNPPYVAESDALPSEVRDYEPHAALYAGKNGLEFYKRLATEGPRHLDRRGLLLVEVGAGQAVAVQELFKEHGWQIRNTWSDLMGIERVMAASPPEVPLP